MVKLVHFKLASPYAAEKAKIDADEFFFVYGLYLICLREISSFLTVQ